MCFKPVVAQKNMIKIYVKQFDGFVDYPDSCSVKLPDWKLQ